MHILNQICRINITFKNSKILSSIFYDWFSVLLGNQQKKTTPQKGGNILSNIDTYISVNIWNQKIFDIKY